MVAAWLVDLYYSLIFATPALYANAVPVFVSGLGRVDGGRNFIDGKALLGSHKTNGGVIAAIFGGGLLGIAAPMFFPEIFFESDLKGYSFVVGFVMGFGAILGDALGSFTKRRIKIKPGAPFPIADQVGFIVVAYLLAMIFVDIPLSWWLIVPTTLLIHLTANILAFVMGWKDVWY